MMRAVMSRARAPAAAAPSRRRRGVVAVLAALVLAQWLALAHAIGHAPGAATTAHDDWGHDAGAPVCQLVDHLIGGQATAPALPTVTPVAATAACPAAPAPASPPAAARHAYLARAPPRG